MFYVSIVVDIFILFLFYVLVLVDVLSFFIFFSYIGTLFLLYVITMAHFAIKNHTVEDDFG